MIAEQSEKIDDLVKDLVKALAEIPHPHKDAVNPHFKSKFASLPGVIDTVRPVLAKYGLAVFQSLGSGERGPVIHTTIFHRSGQWLRQPPLEVPAVKQDPQAYGSAASYGRRYALLAVCGVTGDEDDDANEASRPAPQKPKVPAPTVQAPASIKKPAEPKTAAEFQKWLGDLDAYALRTGLIARSGDLLHHVNDEGIKRNKIHPNEWGAVVIEWAVLYAREHAESLKAAKKAKAG